MVAGSWVESKRAGCGSIFSSFLLLSAAKSIAEEPEREVGTQNKDVAVGAGGGT